MTEAEASLAADLLMKYLVRRNQRLLLHLVTELANDHCCSRWHRHDGWYTRHHGEEQGLCICPSWSWWGRPNTMLLTHCKQCCWFFYFFEPRLARPACGEPGAETCAVQVDVETDVWNRCMHSAASGSPSYRKSRSRMRCVIPKGHILRRTVNSCQSYLEHGSLLSTACTRKRTESIFISVIWVHDRESPRLNIGKTPEGLL